MKIYFIARRFDENLLFADSLASGRKNFSKMSIFPVDVGSLSPSYLLKSPSFDDKTMEINLK